MQIAASDNEAAGEGAVLGELQTAKPATRADFLTCGLENFSLNCQE